MPQKRPLLLELVPSCAGASACGPTCRLNKVIDYRLVQRRKIQWAKQPIYAENYPSIDPFMPVKHRKFRRRPDPPPLPAIPDDEPQPVPSATINYQRMAILQEAAGGMSYPALDTFAYTEPLGEIVVFEPEETLPSVSLQSEQPPVYAPQTMAHATTTRGMGRVR
jgi:hypothetical protein